jgi:hypothetical protein
MNRLFVNVLQLEVKNLLRVLGHGAKVMAAAGEHLVGPLLGVCRRSEDPETGGQEKQLQKQDRAVHGVISQERTGVLGSTAD